jgi:hypothetical protein
VDVVRAALSGALIAGAALLFASLAPLSSGRSRALQVLAVVASIAFLWLFRRVFSRPHVAMWMEEQAPEMRWALATLVEALATPLAPLLDARVRTARFRRPLAVAVLRLAGVPLVIFLFAQFVARPRLERSSAMHAREDLAAARATAGTRAFSAVVTPPRYTRLTPETLDDPRTVAAFAGSDLLFRGRWSGHATMPTRPTVTRLRDSDGTERLVALEPRVDSAPLVVLTLPPRDSVFASAKGVVQLSASARDDLGVVAAWFEMIVSSGSGESFKSRSTVFGRILAQGARSIVIGSAIRLDTLGLAPGDVVHVRALARDANPASVDPGSSETRALRIYRASDDDSVAVEGVPAPEITSSELSQRMLITLAERLVARQRATAREAFVTGSGAIAADQAKLRKRVGDMIYMRLTGESPSETLVPPEGETPSEALLRAASEATGTGAGEALEEAEGEDSPIVSVNRPLLTAYNEMWDAERRLGVGEPAAALPHMRAALASIEAARAAERLYLRGKAPRVALDIARIRLTGKKDGIDPSSRTPGPSDSASVARRRRFASAIAMLADARAAMDSLTLLRVDALADNAALAAALRDAIDALDAGRDALPALRRARSALEGTPERGANLRWSGAW